MDDAFAEVVQKIARLYDAGVDAQTIAAALRHDAVPVPLGAPQWTAPLVDRVLTLARSQRESVARSRPPLEPRGLGHGNL
jgi:hypothetical protein